MRQDEQAAIDRILGGDEAAYGLLIDRHKEGLYRHCFRFVQDEDQAEDIAQEAFIQAYIQLEKFDRAYRFSTWLYKIATNIALQELRRRRPDRLTDDQLEHIVSSLPDVAQAASHEELYKAIAALPIKQQKALTLHYWQGKKYREIARELKTTTGTVKGWMYRAKQQLKEILS